MLSELIQLREAPANRVGKHEGDSERHFPEAAVMLAFAMHFLRMDEANAVHIHPDGEHGKRFDIKLWLESNGFVQTERMGTTSYGGRYKDSAGRLIEVNPKSGMSDVWADTKDGLILAECKGGIINTRHAGQVSRLSKGLCEAVGQLMACPRGRRLYAVVPRTPATERLASRLHKRCSAAGISIALVTHNGVVEVL